MKLVTVPLLLLSLSVPARAEGTLILLSCHRTVVRDAHGLDKVQLDGVSVRPAVKERCVGDEHDYIQVELYSAVHLTDAGICEAAVYDDRRRPTGVILRAGARGSDCPAQDIAEYVQTQKISDGEYLTVSRYWGLLRETPILVTNEIGKHATAPSDPYDSAAVSALKRHMGDDLKSGQAKLENISPLTGDELSDLARSGHRTTRAYHVGARGGYEMTLIPRLGGFEVVDVGHIVP